MFFDCIESEKKIKTMEVRNSKQNRERERKIPSHLENVKLVCKTRHFRAVFDAFHIVKKANVGLFFLVKNAKTRPLRYTPAMTPTIVLITANE